MDRACGTHGGKPNGYSVLARKPERKQLEDLCVDARQNKKKNGF